MVHPMNDIKLEEVFPLFNEIPLQIQNQIKESSIFQSYTNKKIVFVKNEPLRYLYLIISGTIHIVKEDKEGKEQIVSILRRGDFFPHIGLFEKNTVTPGTAFTTEDSVLLLIPLDKFKNTAIKYPVILVEYSKVLSKKILELQSRLEEKTFYNTYQQIIRRILFLAEQYGEVLNEEKTMLKISLTHEEIAHLVGTTRETVSRSIAKLKKIDAVTIKHGNWLLNTSILKEQL